MNLAETRVTMNMLTAAYPSWRIQEPTVAMWAKKLEPFPYEDVDAAVNKWIEGEDRAPTIAGVLELVKQQALYRHGEAADTRGLPEPAKAVNKQQVRKFMALMRGALAERDKRPHWHGGPEPCPVCGGIEPGVRVPEDAA